MLKYFWHFIQVAFAFLGGFIVWFLGGIDGYVYVLVAFIVADYITGVMKSIVKRKLSSQIGARGIFKKVLIFMLIGLSNLVDEYLLLDFGVFRTAVVIFYISNEGVSILENAHAIGLPIPAKLRNSLLQLRYEAVDKNKGNVNDKTTK